MPLNGADEYSIHSNTRQTRVGQLMRRRQRVLWSFVCSFTCVAFTATVGSKLPLPPQLCFDLSDHLGSFEIGGG